MHVTQGRKMHVRLSTNISLYRVSLKQTNIGRYTACWIALLPMTLQTFSNIDYPYSCVKSTIFQLTSRGPSLCDS